jgi:SAM-dependent methyltransferase
MTEITDVMWSFDGHGRRLPVAMTEVVRLLNAENDRYGARIVSRIPSVNGVLDYSHVDALGIEAHRELQQLGEWLQFGRCVADTLAPIVARVRRASRAGTVRIVDLGCGAGYVIRWLSANGALGDDVQLIGVDINPVLIREASRISGDQYLKCKFIVGNAFAPSAIIEDGDDIIVMSTGLMHHMAESDLPRFFSEQSNLRVAAFVHWDICPSPLSTLGSWIVHRLRVRQSIARHDGVISARRAHAREELLSAARGNAPGYLVKVQRTTPSLPIALNIVRPIVGIRKP